MWHMLVKEYRRLYWKLKTHMHGDMTHMDLVDESSDVVPYVQGTG